MYAGRSVGASRTSEGRESQRASGELVEQKDIPRRGTLGKENRCAQRVSKNIARLIWASGDSDQDISEGGTKTLIGPQGLKHIFSPSALGNNNGAIRTTCHCRLIIAGNELGVVRTKS